jgi:hypothetical protein
MHKGFVRCVLFLIFIIVFLCNIGYCLTINLEKEFTVFRINLSVTDLDGTLDEAKENNPGAYVHYNLDDDNTNDTPDSTEWQTIQSENDLLNAKIEFEPSTVNLTKGKVTLKAGQNLRVWSSYTKGSGTDILTNQQKTWDLSDPSQLADFNNLRSILYVEGCLDNVSSLTVEYENEKGVLASSDVVKYTFIAATCGRQPTRDERFGLNGLEMALRNLVPCEYSITGEIDSTYNCIAWSVGETDKWYENVRNSSQYPPNVVIIDEQWGNSDGTLSIAEIDAFYFDKGYVPTGTNAQDSEIMYYDGYHGARKKTSCTCGAGKWIMYESKLGGRQRIEHVWDQVNSGSYGSPIRFYKHR